MSHKHVEFISKNKFPNTYVALLPTELLELLNAYYFGPLEISFNYDKGFLHVRYFDSNNDGIADIEVDVVIFDLIKRYKLHPKDGYYGHRKSQIHWTKTLVVIACECSRLAFYDNYKINLFWEKLEQLANAITRLEEQNLSYNGIYLKLTTLFF